MALVGGKVVGHYKIVVEAVRWKCTSDGIYNMPIYVLPVCEKMPLYSKLVVFGFTVFTASIFVLALHMLLKAIKAKDKARQVISLGIITSILGLWILAVSIYRCLKLVTGHHVVLNSFLCHEVSIVTCVLEVMGSMMIIGGAAALTRRKLKF
ncbi:hypothetical protein [Methanopyrus sp.]